MVGHVPLEHGILVRVQAPQQGAKATQCPRAAATGTYIYVTKRPYMGALCYEAQNAVLRAKNEGRKVI